MDTNGAPGEPDQSTGAAAAPPESAELVNERAVQALFDGDHAAAAALYRQSLDIDPENLEALDGLVSALRFAGEVAAAETTLGEAEALVGPTVELSNQRGWMALAREDYDDAADAFRRGVELDATNAKAHEYLVQSLRYAGRLDEADQAAAEAEAALGDTVELSNQRGWTASTRDDYDAAIEAFTHSLELAPDNAAALDALITQYRFADRLDDADEALAAAEVVLGDTVGLSNQRGWIASARDDYGAAGDAFAHSLELDGENMLAHEYLIQSLRFAGRLDEADEALAAATATSAAAQRVELSNQRGWLRAAQGDHDAAADAFRHSLELDATNAKAHEYFVQSLRLAGRLDEADEALTAATASGTDTADLSNQRGWLRSSQDDHDAAIEAFEHSLELAPDDASALDSLVSQYRFADRLDDADRALAAAEAVLGDTVALSNQRGWIASARTNYAAAADAFRHSLELDATNEKAHEWLITSLRLDGRVGDAQAAMRAAEKAVPDGVGLRLERAIMFLQTGSPARALELVDTMLSDPYLGPTARHVSVVALRQVGRLPEASAAITGLREEFPDQLQFVIEAATVLRAEGKADDAIALLRSAGDDSADVIAALAELLEFTGQTTEARALYREVVDAKPDDASANESLGHFLIRQNQRDEARELFEGMRSRDPASAEARNGLAWIHYQEGRYRQAADEFASITKDYPWLYSCKAYEARSLVAIGSEECIQQGAEIARGILAEEPRNTTALETLGIAQYRLGEMAAAERHLRLALDTSPLDGRAHRNLGALLAKTGREEAARDHLTKALELSPSDVRSYVELGNIELQEGNASRAVSLFKQALAHDPRSVEAVRALSVALEAQGKTDEAENLLRRSITQLDSKTRQELHVVLSGLLYRQASASEDDLLMMEALEQAALAVKIDKTSADAFFARGMAYHGLDLPDRAAQSFKRSHELDPDNLAAERNRARLQVQLRTERRSDQRAERYGTALAIGSSVALVALWVAFLLDADDEIDSTVVVALSTTLLALVVIGAILPRLAGFKLAGVEAQLQAAPSDLGQGPSAAGATLAGRPAQPLTSRPPTAATEIR